MDESYRKRRNRGALPIEPIVFLALSEEFKERIKEKEAHLRAARLSNFSTNLEVPWPWPADLAEFVLSAHATKFRRCSSRRQVVRFDTEAIAQVTTLPDEDNVSVAAFCRAIDASEWSPG